MPHTKRNQFKQLNNINKGKDEEKRRRRSKLAIYPIPFIGNDLFSIQASSPVNHWGMCLELSNEVEKIIINIHII